MSGRYFKLTYKPIKLKLLMILIKQQRKYFKLLDRKMYDVILNIDFVISSPTLRCYRIKKSFNSKSFF